MKRKEIKKMRLVYLKPELDDLSQGQRISFARQIRLMTQDDLSDKLGITGENKRRTMTRYEKGERNPKEKTNINIHNRYYNNNFI
jgi:transcriptional regulator with XRE-family HTH domain